RRYVLSAGKLHGDDVPVPVLAPGNGKTSTGRLWTYVRDDRPAGSGEAPAVEKKRRYEYRNTRMATRSGVDYIIWAMTNY
ncbi:MAG: family transposase, partial [Candidatus Sulfotelmatobacter sp.]|nr:family transposase [Candidatus Sulfotelmatobacter sp.]